MTLPDRLIQAAPIIVALIIMALALSLGGCHAGLSVEFSRGAHKAERAIYGVLAPEYSAYVQADSTLAKDDREDRLALVRAWGVRLGQDSATIGTAEDGQ